MDNRSEEPPRTPPPAVDLRRSHAPRIDIVDWTTYDFVISLHVTLVASHSELHEFDIGKEWVAQARARCDAADPRALDILGLYIGDDRPSSLRATVISLIGLCPDPSTPQLFLDWLREMPVFDFAEALLDQEGLSADWPTHLHAALDEHAGSGAGGPAERRLLANYTDEARPVAQRVLNDVEGVRAEIIAALRVWYEAVFKSEEPQLAPTLRREAEVMRRRLAEASQQHDFIEREMRGVKWQRSPGLRRYIFAPSVFCRPAVFYHFWRGTLTFCAPVDPAAQWPDEYPGDPESPSEEMVIFFAMLGDETRLAILRQLTHRQMYLTELADALKLTKATIQHHMVRLRASGMVTLHDRRAHEHKTYYTLRPDIARRARQYLDVFLRSDPNNPS
ncbi:MAG: ArsR/SmtB family transcription factor [Ktedonobacterales bacterium]